MILIKLKINPSPDDKMPFGDEMMTKDEKPVDDLLKFNFKKGNPSTLVINFPKPKMDEKSKTEDETTEDRRLGYGQCSNGKSN